MSDTPFINDSPVTPLPRASDYLESTNLRFDWDFQGAKHACLHPPTEVFWIQLPSKVPTRVILEQELEKPADETYIYGIFAQVGWLNIGPAAPGPAGPSPHMYNAVTLVWDSLRLTPDWWIDTTDCLTVFSGFSVRFCINEEEVIRQQVIFRTQVGKWITSSFMLNRVWCMHVG